MRVAVYHQSVPNNKNQEKIDLLKNFSQGVKSCGDIVIDVHDHAVHDADVGVIQGWITEESSRPHQRLRHSIIKRQRVHEQHVISADSNLFLYSDISNPRHYLRYSFDGVFPNTGIYCDQSPDPSRWQKISRELNISVKPYRNTGGHILLCLQRNGGWSMGNYQVIDWLANTILKLREHSDRPIVIRPHPGDKTAREYIGSFNQNRELKNTRVSSAGTTLIDDLQGAWAVVNHNSSPVVGAAIEGYPIFVTDPGRSQCYDIANIDLSLIETPCLPDRQGWLERISMFHWNFDELKSGECWNHMRGYL